MNAEIIAIGTELLLGQIVGIVDCFGVVGGGAEVDECGLCNGDGFSCLPSVILSAENNSENSVSIYYETRTQKLSTYIGFMSRL